MLQFSWRELLSDSWELADHVGTITACASIHLDELPLPLSLKHGAALNRAMF